MGKTTKYSNKRKQLLRQLIEAIFNGRELDQFCTDHFPEVYQRFAPESTQDKKIAQLIEYCAHRGCLGHLVTHLEATKPEAYQRFVNRVQQTNGKSAQTPYVSPKPASLNPPKSSEIVRNPEELLDQSLANRYQIHEILDRGGIGVVFKAYDSHLEINVAIKIIDLTQVKLPAMRERVRQEVRTAMKLDHPGIVQVYDFGQVDSLLYIIMEFIPGYHLQKIRDLFRGIDRRVSLPQVLQLVREICLTVDYMHQHRVLHPGTKPENIMLKPTQSSHDLAWQPVLINLGLLRPHREMLLSQHKMSPRRLTYTVSPELLLGHTTDIRSDVYTLGLILYSLVVGRPPFEPKDLAEAIGMHVQEAPVRPRAIDPGIPQTVEEIILKALAKDPSERYISARAMAQALSDYLDSASLLAPEAPARVSLSLATTSLTVVPGETLTTPLSLRNDGTTDHHAQVKVAGIPEEWFSISPSTLIIPPGETREVALSIQPPRSPNSRARGHALTIQAVNQQHRDQVDEIRPVLNVEPYFQFSSNLWPQEISNGQITQVTVENQGNAPETFIVEPKPEPSLAFNPHERLQFKLSPGESRTVDYTVAPTHRFWVADSSTQTFSLLVTSPDDRTAVHSGQVTSHGSVTPRWLYGAVLAILLALFVVFSFYPIVFPPPDAATATVQRATSQAVSQQATLERATSQVVNNRTATVLAGTAQVERTRAAAVQAATATVTWLAGDDDRDGLTNGDELKIGTDPNNRDSDGDGLFDGAEVNEFGTNPFNQDTDFDGLPDDEEIRLTLNAVGRDTDLDGTPDSVDQDPGRLPTPTATITPNPTAQVPVVRFDNTTYTVDERQQTAIITVILDRPVDRQVSVEYETRDNTAAGEIDYTRSTGTLIFDPNQTAQHFTVLINDDTLSEPDETVLLRLQNPQGANLGFNSQATLTILDDENGDNSSDNGAVQIRFSAPGSLFSLPTYEVRENQTRAIIEVLLSESVPRQVQVDYAVSDNTATSGRDYQQTFDTLVFNPGQQRQTFEIQILNDSDKEDEEIANISLNNAVGASIATSRARLVILDDD